MSLPIFRVFVPAVTVLLLLACSQAPRREEPTVTTDKKLAICLILDTGMEDDRTFNAHALAGARQAADKHGFLLTYTTAPSEQDYESHIETVLADRPDLVVTVGFRMGDATARAARRHPDARFAIVDVAYRPGFGCPESVADCYSPEGGLANVTSLIFAEDQVGYLAGVLAAAMTKTGTVACIAGPDVLPVVRFVTGFQAGARATRPEITTLEVYLPSFNDPELGKVKARNFIDRGADVLFGVGGNSGNGALEVGHQRGVMLIGVDGDQYHTLPAVRESLLTSASKKIDVAVAQLLDDFVAGRLPPGIRTATLANGGVDLAPFHDWEERIGPDVRAKLRTARERVIADPGITGAR